jgi:hypothetical protein
MKIDVVASIPDTKKITAEFENLSVEEAVNRLIVLEKETETALSTSTDY